MSVAIVTGSDSGIGKATAVVLAEQGWDVGVTWHRDQEGADDTAREVEAAGQRAAVRRLDLNEQGDIGSIIDELADELGGLDAVVNNAGLGVSVPFLECTLQQWNQVLGVNLTGSFLAGQHAARRMVEGGTRGRIVNVTSVHEHVPLRRSAPYCASKGGLGLLTKVMALELAEHGITVNAVAPGEIATPMTGQPDTDPTTLERPAIPLGRPGAAREIGEFVAFLCSDAASYATGSSFIVDGGLVLMAAIANQDANS